MDKVVIKSMPENKYQNRYNVCTIVAALSHRRQIKGRYYSQKKLSSILNIFQRLLFL